MKVMGIVCWARRGDGGKMRQCGQLVRETTLLGNDTKAIIRSCDKPPGDAAPVTSRCGNRKAMVEIKVISLDFETVHEKTHKFLISNVICEASEIRCFHFSKRNVIKIVDFSAGRRYFAVGKVLKIRDGGR